MSSKTRTKSQSRFATIPGPMIQRSSFNRTHGHKTTFNEGQLVPILVDEVLPGDTMSLRAHHFGRIATLYQPIMDNVYMDTHFFAVPMRLVWDNWQKFMGEQTNPGDSTDFLIPTNRTEPTAGAQEGDLYDHMGLPIKIRALIHNALPFRAYNLIWNEFFRDENLQDSVEVVKDDGPDFPVTYELLPRGKRHDYFSSALPFPQKGDAVELPLGGLAPVDMSGTFVASAQNTGGTGIPLWNTQSGSFDVALYGGESTGTDARFSNNIQTSEAGSMHWLDPQLVVAGEGSADLSEATAITVNLLRESITLQQMLETDARGGTRYAEIVRAHFGVVSPDARLQRPEYLGGSTAPLNVHSVPNTAGIQNDGAGGNVADLAAYGTIAGSGASWRKSFTEHCIIIGLASIRADLNYQQGMEKMWSRQTRYDFYWPTFANLGEQAVLNKEIYAQGDDDPTGDEEVWGYQERFAEYRYKPNRISGEFRSQADNSLDVWHLAQDFGALPTLDENFIVEKPPIDRIVTVPEEAHFLLDFHFTYNCARPMPAYSVPGLKRF